MATIQDAIIAMAEKEGARDKDGQLTQIQQIPPMLNLALSIYFGRIWSIVRQSSSDQSLEPAVSGPHSHEDTHLIDVRACVRVSVCTCLCVGVSVCRCV